MRYDVKGQLLIINREAIEILADLDQLRTTMALALTDTAMGRATNFPRTVATTSNNEALGFMAAVSATKGYLGYKVVSVFDQNFSQGLNPHQGLVGLLNPENGQPVALFDATSITAVRTAAASAAATEILANPDARHLGFIGAGRQAMEHVKAITRIRPIEEISIWSRSLESAQRFKSEILRLGDFRVHIKMNPQSAAKSADILVTCTPSSKVLISIDDVKDGAHINAIGACRPGLQELILHDRPGLRIYLDSTIACMAEASEILDGLNSRRLSRDAIGKDIGYLLSMPTQLHWRAEEVTVFKSIGLGVEDLYMAAYLFQRAKQLGVGQVVTFGEQVNHD